MAKKQSNTSENSAAEQGAKPGIFIPIPTAEITNAAETARIRAEKEAEEARIRAEKEAEEARKKAEKEAKEKADKKAADAVVALISAIGVVEYTDAFLERINAAKQAYAKLTADQKKLVENADVITTSKKEYDKLKIAAEKAAEEARKKAEKEAKDKADKKAADVVVALIRAIGVVEYTDACLEKINAAKQAYSKLTADQKKFVKNADVLTASEDKYKDFQKAEDTARQKAAKAARKKAEEEVKRKAIEAARKKAEEEARKKAEQEAHDKEIESILLAYCKKKGSSLTNSYSSLDHVEYDMPRNRYDDIYEYVMRKNKEQRNSYILSLDGYDYFFSAANNSYGISVWRKINTDGLWDLNEKKKQIDRTSKIFTIGLVVLWAFFLIVNAIYTWVANSWFSCIIWVIITVVVFYCLMVLVFKASEEFPIETESPNAGSIAHLVWRIIWVLGLSIICEIIMMVIFVF